MKKIGLLLIIVIVILLGFYVIRLQKTNAPIQPSFTPPLVTKAASPKNEIIRALSQKNNWDATQIDVTITTFEGDYAKGTVKLKNEGGGGGLWFAAKVNETWKIVSDGNGIITCDQLANYQNFPKDLIPSCYDKQTNQLLTR